MLFYEAIVYQVNIPGGSGSLVAPMSLFCHFYSFPVAVNTKKKTGQPTNQHHDGPSSTKTTANWIRLKTATVRPSPLNQRRLLLWHAWEYFAWKVHSVTWYYKAAVVLQRDKEKAQRKKMNFNEGNSFVLLRVKIPFDCVKIHGHCISVATDILMAMAFWQSNSWKVASNPDFIYTTTHTLTFMYQPRWRASVCLIKNRVGYSFTNHAFANPSCESRKMPNCSSHR